MKHMQKFTAAAMAVLLLGFTVVPAFLLRPHPPPRRRSSTPWQTPPAR